MLTSDKKEILKPVLSPVLRPCIFADEKRKFKMVSSSLNALMLKNFTYKNKTMLRVKRIVVKFHLTRQFHLINIFKDNWIFSSGVFLIFMDFKIKFHPWMTLLLDPQNRQWLISDKQSIRIVLKNKVWNPQSFSDGVVKGI